jgi:pSer/pThr/pTyr-binding forkhead associated (FHA) protein
VSARGYAHFARAVRRSSSSSASTRRIQRVAVPVSSLKFVPAGDGGTAHLRPGAKIPEGITTNVIRLPSRAGATALVGRSKSASIVLDIQTVGREHARLYVDEERRVFVTDLGSKNGTVINGKYLQKGQPYEIFAGDFISFGDAHLAKFEAVMTPAGMERAPPKRRNDKIVIVDMIKAGWTAAEQIANAVASASTSASASAPPPPPPSPPRESFDDAPLAELPEGALEEMDPKPAVKDSIACDGPESSARIVLTPSEWSGPVVELERDEVVVIGTSTKKGDVDVMLSSPQVDAVHASIARVGNDVYVEDMQSSSGTFVAGRQIKPGLQYRLSVGESFMLGDGGCAFVITVIEEEAESERQQREDVLSLAPSSGATDVTDIVRSTSDVEIIQNEDLSLSSVNDGSEPLASPWSVLGGLKGMGENIGAAIFNSNINVNYSYKPNVSIGGSGKVAGLADLKAAVLLAISDTERGLRADKERRRKIEQLVRALEAKNPTRAPLKSPLMNGRWALVYTTQLDVVGKGKPGFLQPKGSIFQTLDIFTLQVKNEETFEPLPFLKFTNSSVFDLNAMTDSRARVKPKEYRVAGVRMVAPPTSPSRVVRDMEMEASGAGALAWQDCTFVDTEMRVTRSQTGEFYVFVRDDENDVEQLDA